jgi:hypothetical protein
MNEMLDISLMLIFRWKKKKKKRTERMETVRSILLSSAENITIINKKIKNILDLSSFILENLSIVTSFKIVTCSRSKKDIYFFLLHQNQAEPLSE